MLECPLCNLIRDKFQSLFEKVLGSLESFFQLDHQVDISMHFTEATTLCHSRELAGLTPLYCIYSPVSFSASQTLKSIWFHCAMSWSFLHVKQLHSSILNCKIVREYIEPTRGAFTNNCSCACGCDWWSNVLSTTCTKQCVHISVVHCCVISIHHLPSMPVCECRGNRTYNTFHLHTRCSCRWSRLNLNYSSSSRCNPGSGNKN